MEPCDHIEIWGGMKGGGGGREGWSSKLRGGSHGCGLWRGVWKC